MPSPGNLVVMIAAIVEKRSTHCDIFETGGRVGAGAQSGLVGQSSSSVMSMNSRSSMPLATFPEMAAASPERMR